MKKTKYIYFFLLFSLIINNLSAKITNKNTETYLLVERKAPQKSYKVVQNTLMSLYDKAPKEAIIELPFNNVNQKFNIERKDVNFSNTLTFLSDGRFFAGKENVGISYKVTNEFNDYCGQLMVFNDNIFCDITHFNKTISISKDNFGCVNVKIIDEEKSKEETYKNIVDLVVNNKSLKNTKISKNISLKLDSILNEKENQNKPNKIKEFKKDSEFDFLIDTAKYSNNVRNNNTGDGHCLSIPLYIDVSYDYYIKSQHPANVQTGMGDSSAYKRVNQKIRYYFNRAIQVFEAEAIFLHIALVYIRTKDENNPIYVTNVLNQYKNVLQYQRPRYRSTNDIQHISTISYKTDNELDALEMNGIYDIGGRSARDLFNDRKKDKIWFRGGMEDYLLARWYNDYNPKVVDHPKNNPQWNEYLLGRLIYNANNDTIPDTLLIPFSELPQGIPIYIGQPRLPDSYDNTNPMVGDKGNQITDRYYQELFIDRYASTNVLLSPYPLQLNENNNGSKFSTTSRNTYTSVSNEPGYQGHNYLPMYSNMPNNLNDLITVNDGGCHLKDIGIYSNGAGSSYWADFGWSNNYTAETRGFSVIPLLGDTSYYTYDPPPYTSANGIYPPPSANNVKFNIKDHDELYGEKREFGDTDYPVFNLAKWNTWMIIHHISGQLGVRIFHDYYAKNDVLSPVARNNNTNALTYNNEYGSPYVANIPITSGFQYREQVNTFGQALLSYMSRRWLDNTLQVFSGGMTVGSSWLPSHALVLGAQFAFSSFTPYGIFADGGYWQTAAGVASSSSTGYHQSGYTAGSGQTALNNTNAKAAATRNGEYIGWGQHYIQNLALLACVAIAWNALDMINFGMQYGWDVTNLSEYYDIWNPYWPLVNDEKIFGALSHRHNAKYNYLDLNTNPGIAPVDFVSFSKGFHKKTGDELRLHFTNDRAKTLWGNFKRNPYAEIMPYRNYAIGGDTITLMARDSALIRLFSLENKLALWTSDSKKRNILNIFQDFCFGCNEVWTVPTIQLTNEEGNSVIGGAGDYVAKNINKFYCLGTDRTRFGTATYHPKAGVFKDSLAFDWRLPNNAQISHDSVANIPLPNVTSLTMYPVRLQTTGMGSSNYKLKRSNIYDNDLNQLKMLDTSWVRKYYQSQYFAYPTISSTNLNTYNSGNYTPWDYVNNNIISKDSVLSTLNQNMSNILNRIIPNVVSNQGCKSNVATTMIRVYPRTFLPIIEKFTNWYGGNVSLKNWEFIGPWSFGDGPSEYTVFANGNFAPGHYVKGTGPIRDKRMIAGTGWSRATSEFKNLLSGSASDWDGLVYIPRGQTAPLTTTKLKYHEYDFATNQSAVKFTGQSGNLPPSPFKNWYSKMGFPTGNVLDYGVDNDPNVPYGYPFWDVYNFTNGISSNNFIDPTIKKFMWDKMNYPLHCAYDYWRRGTSDTARSPFYLNNNRENKHLVVSFDWSTFVPNEGAFNEPFDKLYFTTDAEWATITQKAQKERQVFHAMISDTLSLLMYLNNNKQPVTIFKKGGRDLSTADRGYDNFGGPNNFNYGFYASFPYLTGTYSLGKDTDYDFWNFIGFKVYHKPRAKYDNKEWKRMSIDLSQYDSSTYSVQFDFVYLNNDGYANKYSKFDGVYGVWSENSGEYRYSEYDYGSKHSPLFITNFKVYSTGQLPLLNGIIKQSPDSVESEVGCDKCVSIGLNLPANNNALKYIIYRSNSNGTTTPIYTYNFQKTYYANPNDTGYTNNGEWLAAGNDIQVCNIRYGQSATFFAKIINNSGNTIDDTIQTPPFTVTNTCIPCKVKAPLLGVDSTFNRDGNYIFKAAFSDNHLAKVMSLQYLGPDDIWTPLGIGYVNITDPNGNTYLYNNYGYNAGLNQGTFGVYTFPQITNQVNGVKTYRVVARNNTCEPTTTSSNLVDVTVCKTCKSLGKPILLTDSALNRGKYTVTIKLPINHNGQTLQLYERAENTVQSNSYGNLIKTLTITSNNEFTYVHYLNGKSNGGYVYTAVLINNTLPVIANKAYSDRLKVNVIQSIYDCMVFNPYMARVNTPTGFQPYLKFEINRNCDITKNLVKMYRVKSLGLYLATDPTLTTEILNLMPIVTPSETKFSDSGNNLGYLKFTNSELTNNFFYRSITPKLGIYNCWYKVEISCGSCQQNNTKTFFTFIKTPINQN